MNACKARVLVCLIFTGVLASTALAAVKIEVVPVGDPGNAADTRYTTRGYGSVGYTYNIGKYEVTAGQYCDFLNRVAATDPYGLYNTQMWSNQYGCKIQRSGFSGNYTYSVADDMANRPVDYVSWGDSARFANWLHNGQPTGAQGLETTEDGAYFLNGATTHTQLLSVTRQADWKCAIADSQEWYKAAYYNPDAGSYYYYPTSSDIAPGRDLADTSGKNANYYGTPYPIDSGKYTTVVGQFKDSASPYGTFDQGGNVWEWSETTVGSFRTIRGGSFENSATVLCAASGSYYGDGTHEDYGQGFRLVQVPDPATLSLLALAGAGLLARQRRARDRLRS